MKLKALLTKEEFERLPKDLQENYTQSGDEYVLDVADTEFKSKLDEFRTNNRKLSGERERLEAALKKFEGVDVEKYNTVLEQIAEIDKLEEKDLIKAGKLDDVISRRTKKMQDEYEGRLKQKDDALAERDTQINTFRSRLGTLQVDTLATKHAGAKGSIRKSATNDVLGRARETWKIDKDGNVVPLDAEGKTIYGKNGKDPLTWEEWAEGLLKEAPHLFESGGGGGAGGGSKGAGNGTPNVISNDPTAIAQNLEAVAKGTVKVQATTHTP